MESVHRSFAKAGLYRVREGKWAAGVCTGIARKTGADPNLVRLVFALLLLLPGSQLIVYPVLWLLMPDDEAARRYAVEASQWTTPQDTLRR